MADNDSCSKPLVTRYIGLNYFNWQLVRLEIFVTVDKELLLEAEISHQPYPYFSMMNLSLTRAEAKFLPLNTITRATILLFCTPSDK